MAKQYEYDVALSFAGEDREYVNAVATHLQACDIKVFYDMFEQVDLWGKELYTHLDGVYRHKARFCVMFISENYQRKNWTNHERESAQARAFQENEDYILPARFDDTEIPGVRPTVGYINLRDHTPKQFAQLCKLKLGRSDSLSLSKSRLGATSLKPSKKTVGDDRQKSHGAILSKRNRVSPVSKPPKPKTNRSKPLKPKTKTVDLTLDGIGQLPDDKPVVYKILTKGNRNNYTGVAKRGKIQATLQEHLQSGKNYVPGARVYIERMNSIKEAQQKADRIIQKSAPKYNKPIA
jgi:hypothetical protein